MCPSTACWLVPAAYSTHGSHRDITPGIDAANIVFNFNAWNTLPSPQSSWRVEVSAHEWGHNMSLQDHVGDDICDDPVMPSIMDSDPDSLCPQSPTAPDRNSVRCEVYARCNETQQALRYASFEHPAYTANWGLIPPAGGDGGIVSSLSTIGGAKSGPTFLDVFPWDNAQPAGWPGASIYQDIPWAALVGGSFAFNFWAKSPTGTCISVTVVVWAVTNGVGYEHQDTLTSVCANTWMFFSAPLDVAVNRSSMRAQIYVWTPNKSLYIDGTELMQSLTTNSSFEQGTTGWNTGTAINHFEAHSYSGSGPSGRSGLKYLHTRTLTPGPNSYVYQDRIWYPSPGESYRFLARVRSPSGAALSGYITLFATSPGGTQEDSTTYFTTQGYGTNWSYITGALDVKNCCHTGLRATIYLTAGTSYYEFDGTAVYRSLLGNGSFEMSLIWPPPGWNEFEAPNGVTNYSADDPVGCCSARTGANVLLVNSDPAGGSVYQEIPITPQVIGESYTFSVWARCRPAGGQCPISLGISLFALGTGQAQGVNVTVNSTSWQQYIAPLDISLAGATGLRAQIYVNTGSWYTVEVDATGNSASP